MSLDYVKKIKKVIADKTGQEPEEIEEAAYFEDDLNVGEMELIDILETLEDALHVELIKEKANIETVQNLIELVEEQVE